MTSLVGEFQAELPLADALVACSDAIDGLGWEIETVKSDRIVAVADSSSSAPGPKIEVELEGNGNATTVRIIGSDREAHPLSESQLIESLDQARDAIQSTIQSPSKGAAGPPAGWYENLDGPGQRWWDGSGWTDHVRVAEPQPTEPAPPQATPPPPRRPSPPPRAKDSGKDGSIGQRLAIVAAGILAIAVLAGGAWFVFVRDTGPSDAELAAQKRARQERLEKAKARAIAQRCNEQTGDLLTALKDLESRLNGVGVNYEDYGQRVGDVNSAYGQIPFNSLGPDCLIEVGLPEEKAVNSFIKAGSTWNDCFDDINCDIDSIDPELQDRWSDASGSIRVAERGLSSLAQP